VTEPQWLDVATPTVQLRALTWGLTDAPRWDQSTAPKLRSDRDSSENSDL
jgi:hypothetical protein